ncbi:hypothetical protein [Hyphococcus sp.]|uniref:hypothetical protein n=1 Tax=Hyphococcus sp. TaxID=2038636 RepID=UPI0035C6D0FF
MSDIVTTDLSRFGYRELKMAASLLAAYCESPPDFLGDGVTVMFNTRSGCVFLTDEDFNVGMMNGDRLEQFHTCFECGAEGFAEEIDDHECK